MKFKLCSLLILTLFVKTAYAQQPPTYPRVTGYFSFVTPIATWTNNHITPNFSDGYSIGFPMGINLLKSDKFGISFEIAPTIRTENNVSKVSTVLFHPGAMFRFNHGFTIIGRLAFETSGRFGVTPVFNKVVIKGKDANLFVSVPFPVRMGNNLPLSIGTGLQVGVSF